MAFVVDDRLVVSLVSVLGVFLIISILTFALQYRKSLRHNAASGTVNLNSVKIMLPFGREGVLKEIGRLSQGGDLNETLIRSLSAEDKTLFEVALIEALTELPREEQHLLRSTLVRHGYDEQCSRRLMKGEISDRIRASTLLDLLRPQWHTMSTDRPEASVDQEPARARSARSGGAASHDGI